MLLLLVPPIAAATDDPFLIKIFTRVMVFAIAAVALNFMLGFGDLVSLLQAGLLGVGGYAVGILAHHDFEGTLLFGRDPRHLEPRHHDAARRAASRRRSRSSPGSSACAPAAPYFIMITLAFNQMLYYFFVALQQYGGEDGLQVLEQSALRRLRHHQAGAVLLRLPRRSWRWCWWCSIG